MNSKIALTRYKDTVTGKRLTEAAKILGVSERITRKYVESDQPYYDPLRKEKKRNCREKGCFDNTMVKSYFYCEKHYPSNMNDYDLEMEK